MRHRFVVALLFALGADGCSLTHPTRCQPVHTVTVSRVVVRDSAGAELARGSVVVQSIEGDTVPAWFILSVYAQSGPAVLLGHVTSAALIDSAGSPVHVAVLESPRTYTAYSGMRLHDPAYIADLRRRLEQGTLRLELTTDLPALAILRSPLVYSPAESGVRPPVCFATG